MQLDITPLYLSKYPGNSEIFQKEKEANARYDHPRLGYVPFMISINWPC